MASLPPPSNLSHPLGMPDMPTCLPSPSLPAKHEKHATCVFGTAPPVPTCTVPLMPSMFPLVPDTAHSLHPPSRRTRKTHPDGCGFCVRRTLCFPRAHQTCGCVLCAQCALFLCPHVEHRQHTHMSVLFMFGAPFAFPLASNMENTPTMVCSLCLVLPVHPPFAPDTENTPIWMCSLVFSPCPHCASPSSSLLVTAFLGKFLF